ncbi:MAG: hypothetical protein PHQ23_10065 [Candidatus Wallbacteria bacterium]|nr:hypothetical protein [Candidatus Wallbacteria bacterium]
MQKAEWLLKLADLKTYLEDLVSVEGIRILDVEDTGKYKPHITIFIYGSNRDIGTDDCQNVNRLAEVFLDGVEGFPQEYSLEVSTPGLTRKLRKDCDFQFAIGKEIEIWHTDENSARQTSGMLLSCSTNTLLLKLPDNTELTVPREKIKKAGLLFKWGGKND